ncbi:uncharacterized protein TNCV_4617971 [Trichonephila clavipes]|nr:uncharacterized protein TNCV_4617971 [Trichonephila clavipes]
MPNSSSQRIPDSLDWRNISGLGRLRKGSNSVETVLWHPCRFPHARHRSKRSLRWMGVKGSTRNGRRDPKCPSARRLRMVRGDTGASNEGAICAYMARKEEVAVRVHFLRSSL